MSATHQISPAETKTRVAAALTAAGIAGEIHERRGVITPNSQAVLDRRYLAKDPDGAITEDTRGMFRRVARNLSQADLLYGASEEQRQQTEDAFYDAISTLELLPNSPTLMNAGRELQQLSACFVLPVEDDLDSIFESVKHTAIIHKSGGGTGFAFSRLRPEGSKVGSTGGVASGPVSFINAFDTATDVVKQGGTRRGANMGILNVTHPDIMKFVRAKSNGGKLQNFNISVGATREFMRCVLDGGDYALVNPTTGIKTGELNAQAVFEEICRNAWHNGDPGLVLPRPHQPRQPQPATGRNRKHQPVRDRGHHSDDNPGTQASQRPRGGRIHRHSRWPDFPINQRGLLPRRHQADHKSHRLTDARFPQAPINQTHTQPPGVGGKDNRHRMDRSGKHQDRRPDTHSRPPNQITSATHHQ